MTTERDEAITLASRRVPLNFLTDVDAMLKLFIGLLRSYAESQSSSDLIVLINVLRTRLDLEIMNKPEEEV